MTNKFNMLGATLVGVLGLSFATPFCQDVAHAKESSADKKLEQKYMDRQNEENIDKVSKDQYGYDIAMKPAQDDENYESVKPKSMKVYKKEKGKLKDITDKGVVSKDTNGAFIRWTFKHNDKKPVAKDLKKEIGKDIVFDVTYEKPVKPNTTTKDGQFVNKQIHELKHKLDDDKEDNNKKALKKHKKLLKDNEEWKNKIKKEKKKTHRYAHEIRYK